MIASGVLILLFVTYQLWGTGLRTDAAQNDLKRQYEQIQADARAAGSKAQTGAKQPGENAAGTTSTTAPLATLPGEGTPASGQIPPPKPGVPIGQIKIPKIGVDFFMVEGV